MDGQEDERAGAAQPGPGQLTGMAGGSAHEGAEAVLRETRQFYVALDEAGVVRGWNRAATRTFGYTEQQALGAVLSELIIPSSYRAAHRQGLEDFVRTGHGRAIDAHVEVLALRAVGSQVPVELTIWAQSTDSGYVFHALGSDVSERQAHERVLRVLAEHRRRLLHLDRPEDARRLLVETVCRATGCDGVWLYVPDSREAPTTLTLAAESLGDAGPGSPVRGPDAADGRLWSALSDQTRSFTCDTPLAGPAARPAGDLLSLAVEPVVVRDEAVGVLVVGWRTRRAALSDSTQDLLSLLGAEAGVVMQRLELQEQLVAAARTDSLTGLPNRRTFDEALVRELQRAARVGGTLALVLVDLDHFKSYNDAYGHPAGDELLRRVTAAWSGVVRSPDLLARIGGDEFALLLPDADRAAAATAVARLVSVTPDGASLSAGTAVRCDGDDAATLLQRADQALYQRKRSRT